MRRSVLTAWVAALALASLTLLATGIAAQAETAYPEEAAAVTALTLEPDGSQPVALAVNSSTSRIYAANAGSDNVSVIDGASGTVIATIAVGPAPRGIAVDAKANRVYVASSASNEVTVIDGGSNEVVATLSTGKEPWGIAADSSTGRVFISNRGDGTVSVIDGRHNLRIATVTVGNLPTAVAVNPDTGRVYVTSDGSGDLWVIDGRSNLLIDTLSLASDSSVEAWDVAVDSSANRVYVATSAEEASDADGGTVLVIDGSNNSLVNSVAIPSSVEALAADSTSGRVYGGSSSDDRMWVIDDRAGVLMSAVGLEGGLSAVDVDSASGRVYVAHGDSNSISIVYWLPGVTLAPGWTYVCYFGDERLLADALADTRDHVLAVYRPGPDEGYDRWFPDRPDLSTIRTVRPGDALFVLANEYTPWVQEPSQDGGDLVLAPGWNSICYWGESEKATVAVGEMSDQIAVGYGLGADGTWRRYVPARPDLTTMAYVRGFSPLILLIPPEPESAAEYFSEEVSEEFLALQADLENRIRNYYGDVAICVADLQTNEQICVNGDALHSTGCTLNMFTLFMVMEEFIAGRARAEDWAYWIKIGIGHSSPPQVAVFVRGIKGSLEEGTRRADELMRSWGMKESVYGYVPGYPGQDWRPNILTASETNMILAKLYREELFSPEWTAYAIDRLLDIKPGLNYVLPLFLPAGVRVAHKIGYFQGWNGWVYNDVGIVMMTRGDRQIAYAISYLSQLMPTEYAAYIFGAELSKAVYDWFDQRY
ncbi:MAG: serine hydrolase [Dehalococcoidia bacterium]|nr:MAG: serine hydrolase [Dehalococcoidia bacterium]